MALTGWEREQSPYHAGEQELHERLGRKEHQEKMGRQIHRPYMPDQHIEFFKQLPFFIVGAVDQHDRPWASILFGQPGFIAVPDAKTLKIDAAPVPGDALSEALRIGDAVGFLGIELETRRRNRVNGIVSDRGNDSFTVGVVQSYGNCPQYIHTRQSSYPSSSQSVKPYPTESFSEITDEVTAVIQAADTLFVASYNDRDDKQTNGGADVSHRGGKPGFVKVEGNTLTIPDYVGNFFFNTLGNFLVNPKAGLLFVDFEGGDLYQLTGTVELLWDKTEEIAHFRGAERAWRFHLQHGIRLKGAAPLQWRPGEPSPNSLLTGDWKDAEQLQLAQARRREWRALSVYKVDDESATIRSIYLRPTQGDTLYNYKPGQYLTVRVTPNNSEPVIRTYTLSSSPSDPSYRISVKRESDGQASRFLHDTLSPGDTIEALAPNGSFWIDTEEDRPAVLIAGGVGITPMISMAREIYQEGIRKRYVRSTTVFHVVRTTAERAFADEFTQLGQSTNSAIRYLSLITQPAQNEKVGEQFHFAGRLTADHLQRVLPIADYDFYLCGPSGFMQSSYDVLINLGVRDARIYSESFGPSELQRVSVVDDARPVAQAEPVDTARVQFSQSQVGKTWKKEDGTLLEMAEANNLAPVYGCRSGACGTCAVKKLSGETRYLNQPTYRLQADEVLLCCAVPAKSDQPLVIDL